jgi:hypothetical protein
VVEFRDLKGHCEKLNSIRNVSVDHIIISLQNIDSSIENMTKLSLDKLDDMLKEVKLSLETYKKERQILESLQFDAMRHRYHAIAEAHRRTFKWVFEPEFFPLSDPRSEIRFKDWLTSEAGIYWISGKPGSGKSTLMKHICESAQTHICLQRWAEKDRLATAAFYFWASGSGMQRSQRGLFQQLLFEILRACPDFISVLCAERWACDPSVDWSLPDLHAAFERLGNLVDNTKICFFIDGLDEYDGDHLELVKILQNISSIHSIKLCISSRPWSVFEDAFGHHLGQKLYLEHLTVDDISRFAREKLEEIPGFAILRQERQIYSDLVLDISRKAQGVFLWVFLVVKSLREGLVNGDNLRTLQERVNAMPSDLEAFFDKLIHSVDKIYQNHMAATIDVAMRSPNSLSMLTYWFLDENNCHSQDLSSRSESLNVYFIEDQMTRKLSGCYKGLLEGTGPIGCRNVDFVHRTVRDYVRLRTVSHIFGQDCLTSNANTLKAFATHYQFIRDSGEITSNYPRTSDIIVFARWAEQESAYLDWKLIENMDAWSSSRFQNYGMRFLLEAVRYGFVSYLERRLRQDGTFISQFEKPLLRAALETQMNKANFVFGPQSSYDTLTWLLRNGANPNLRTSEGTLFLEYLSETRARTMQSSAPWAVEQWEKSLDILLCYGANISDPFQEVRFVEALPKIGHNRAGIEDLASIVLRDPNGLTRANIHRHLNIYAAFLAHGLDPNRQVKSCTLWGIWLWYICAWQSDHGYLEEICVRAVKLFISYHANPFYTIEFISDRVQRPTSPRWTVADIVDTFFSQTGRADLEPIIRSAMRRWGDKTITRNYA